LRVCFGLVKSLSPYNQVTHALAALGCKYLSESVIIWVGKLFPRMPGSGSQRFSWL
jgi:hypothetical protein